jgi:hypothetical protein
MKKRYLFFSILSFISFASYSQVVINEVYGGGGNAGSIYKNDFIELYNNSGSPISLVGWSVQYASSAGTTWQVTNLTGNIPANGHYLIQEAVGAGGTTNLPAPDATGTIAMSATAGKVILCNVTTAQTGACPSGAQIIDVVGFGATANCFEGAGPTPAPSNTTSVQRTPEGTDANNNSVDFTAGAPTPINATGGADVTPPTISSLFPANGANAMTAFTATITFSETVQKGASGTITVKRFSDDAVVQTTNITSATVVVSGAAVSFEVNSLAFATQYYIEITSAAFKDLSNNNFAGITGSGTWSFITSSTPPAGSVGATYNFNTCGTTLSDGFVQYSILGDQKWACTTFGVDATHSATGSAPNGLQINGFLVTNIPNEDWLISPSFDLTGTNYPLFSFWSRTKFNGLPLQLKISTDYPGTGDPGNYTWTDINGKFPGQTTDVWTQSSNINLSAFKTTNTYFAFVYSSSSDDGARWTLDDIQVNNSATPPPPSLTLSTTDIQFGYAASGSNVDKTFIVTGNDITGDITLTASSNFSLSTSPGGPFTSSVTLLQASANNNPTTIYARFAPLQDNQNNINGTITVSTPGVADTTINLKGTSTDPANTLEVVNWNLEWFGSPTLGPTNDAQQQANVQTILQNTGADLYGLVEVVDEARLATVVGNMPGYAYVICNYGSHTNPFEAGAGPLSAAQKEAFVYKTSMFSNISTTPLVTNGVNTAADLTNPAYNYFASGRYPFMMTADVTLNGVTKTIRFVLIHAKANTSPTTTSYNRRKAGSDTLHFTLNNLYPNDNIFILGDFNDDLDQTITDGITPPTTSYVAFTTDNTNFSSPTLALSLAGKKSTVSYNDMIDHVMVSNEMQGYYMNSTASVLTDVTSLVSNYGTTTTDHYPVFTRFAFDPLILPVRLVSFNAIKLGNKTKLNWTTSQEINSREFIVERSTNGSAWQTIATVAARGNANSPVDYTAYDSNPVKGINLYRLKMVDIDNKFDYSATRRVNFDASFTYTIYPNPAADLLQITVDNASGPNVGIEVLNTQGQVLIKKRINIASQPAQLNISSLAAGIYFMRISSPDGSMNMQKFVKE